MSIPNVRLSKNNISKPSTELLTVAGKSNTFLDSYIYAKNSRYNALYEKNKEILQIENYAITKQNASYLYDAFNEHVKVLESVVTRMRNFAFRIKSDVLSNLHSIIPESDILNKFDKSISKTPDIPNFRYIHYNIKPIDYANLAAISSMFDQELKELSSINRIEGGGNAMPHARCTEFIKSITSDYKTSYDGLLNMEEVKIMTPSRRTIISNFYIQKNKIITSVTKDFKTYHFFLQQFKSLVKNCEKLEPKELDNGEILVNGSKMSFTNYVVIYKHFSTMMKDLLDIVSHYDNLFYNKIYALQSNIEVYNSIIKYSIEFMNAKESGDPMNETAVLMEAWWDGYLNSNDIDAHNLINGNYAAKELLWDDACELTDDDSDDEYATDDVIYENSFISKDDLYKDFDKFENGQSNILLITGLTGSGKSTLAKQICSKYNAEYIELDMMDPYSNLCKQGLDTVRKAGEVFYDFLNDHKDVYEKLISDKMSRKDTSFMMDEIIKYCFSWCSKRKDQKFVIEGIQLYDFFNYYKIPVKYPIIIKGTSVIKSFLRKIKREKWNAKEIIKDAPQFLKLMYNNDKQLKDLSDTLDESVDSLYFLYEYNNYGKISSLRIPYNLYYEPLEEGVTMEKITSSVKDKYLTILSYIKDIYRKWQGIETVPVSEEEKKLYHKIITESYMLIDYLLEILENDKPIAYESKYEEFLDNIKEFKKVHGSKKDKDKEISISTLHDNVNKLERALHKSTNSRVEYASKYRTALWVVISRTLYVINILLYNTSGKGQSNTSKSVKKSGIASKRFGTSGMSGISLNKLDESDVTPLLDKLRTVSSYNEYKKVFDKVCSLYKKDNISALKLLDLKKHNKLVFVGYSKLKPMILKAGTILYHISPSDSITNLEPKFKSKDNITFFSKPRIYFTDKYTNPKKVLPNVSNPNIYECVLKHDTKAYRDSEYGSWYHNCIYIETDKTMSVTNITDQFNSSENKELNESIEYKDYFNLSVLNESISEELKDIKEEIKDSDKGTLGCTESELRKLCDKFDNLPDDEKKKKTPIMISILSNVMNTLSYIIGIGFVMDSISEYSKDKEFMKDIKKEMPMNHETYNKIYNAIFFKSILRIVLSVLMSIISIMFIIINISKTSINDLKNIAIKAGNISSKLPSCKSICDKIISSVNKLLPLSAIIESCDCINLYDGDTDIDITTDTINNKELSYKELEYVEDDLPIKEDIAWLQDTGEEVGPICTLRSSIVS